MMRVLVLGLALAAAPAFAGDRRDSLRAFKDNPKAWMDRPLGKFRADGKQVKDLRVWPKKTRAFLANNEKIKDGIDKGILGEGKQGWQAHDRPQDLFEEGVEVETDIFKLKQQAALSVKPWSAYYWPIALGGVSARYADPGFADVVSSALESEEGVKYKDMVDYYKQPDDFFKFSLEDKRMGRSLDFYSPAEKYDLLVGDPKFTLTNLTKSNGFKWEEEDGTVAQWMGICHGWAIASYASPRPNQTIEVKGLSEEAKVNFHPDDLRALISLKWASLSSWEGLYVGGRCNVSAASSKDGNEEDTVTKDEETGRILQEECFDTNPGTWHVVVANKIGRYNESFIMDATFDAEVWNQPVYSYEVRYFNPSRLQLGTLAQSIISMDEKWEKEDVFAKFRKNKKATHIVGVIMDVTYVYEVEPRHGISAPDDLYTVTYTYDLELDTQNNIVGGEWHTNLHPDFLWTKKKKTKARNQTDIAIDRRIDVGKAISEFLTTKDMQTLDKAMHNKLTETNMVSLAIDETPLGIVLDALTRLSALSE